MHAPALSSSLLSWCWPWRYRALLRQFVQRQVLARYRGTVFGVAWSLLTPLLMMAVYTLVFRYVFRWQWAGGSGGGLDFALHLFAGMTVFGFFAEAFTRAPQTVVEQPNLVKKVPFPVEILVWVNTLAALVFALPALALLLLATAASGHAPQAAWAALPLIWLPLLPLLLGLGWLFAALGVYVRDVGQILGLVVSLLQFLSPVFYPVSALPARVQPLLYLNPLTPVIEQTRGALFEGRWPDPAAWLLQCAAGLAVALLGAALFRKLRPGFADVL